MSAIALMPVGKLKVADDNIRREVGDVSELAASIKSVGLLEPLLVRESDNLVVCGARRLAAAKKAGLKELPVIVRPFTEQERLEAMIVENLQRDDLSAVEEGAAFQRLAEMGLTQRDIAAQVGRSQAHVAKRLGLLKLPETVQESVEKGTMRLDDAQELVKLKDDPKLIAKLAKRSGISGAVQHEVAKRDRAKKREAAHAKLVKAGGTVVELKDGSGGYGFNVTAPEGMKLVTATGYGDVVVMEPEKHAKLDCHASGVHPYTLETTEVCTTPANHPDPAAKRQAEQSKAEADRKAETEKREAIAARRQEFLRAHIAGRPDREATLELCYLALLDPPGHWSNADEVALGLLPAPKVDEPVEGQTAEEELDAAIEEAESIPAEPTDVLAEFAAESAVNRLRVTFALAAASLETRPSPDYYAVLVRIGYKPNADEKKAIAA